MRKFLRIFSLNLDWDEEISQDIQFKHLAWREQIPLLRAKAIPRYYFADSDAVDIELHGFSDASESDYAAVVYIRAIQPSGEPTVTLVTAKSKVAPLKKLSMLRLELCGAYLLSKLMHQVRTALNITLDQVHVWTDSTIVLHWLDGSPSFT